METSDDLKVDGKAGEPVTLPIGGGPATGHAWQLDLPQGVTRIEDGPEQQIDPSVRLGGGSGARLRVVASRGDYVITARLARPWELDRAMLVVRIHLHVV